MTATITIDVGYPTPCSSETVEADERNVAVSASPAERSTRMPFSIPRSQLYYWTTRWQTDEAESAAEIERGEGREFPNAEEAIRWLLDPDDE